jgi:hypothetical protein
MVATPLDPLRAPVITLSQAEIEEIREAIEVGILPSDYLAKHFEAVRANVFGLDHKVDARGNPIEQGRGSAMNQTQQSIDAYRKWGKDEIDYEKHLRRMEKELEQSEARRKAEGAGRPRERIR